MYENAGCIEAKSNAAFVDHTWIFLSGAWNGWRSAADPADSSLLYGNRFLFCKKLEKASRLVRRNEALQKASGQLCETACNDNGNKAADRRDSDSRNGDRLLLHETGACRTDLSGGGMGMPSAIFFPAGKDEQACGGSDRITKGKSSQ